MTDQEIKKIEKESQETEIPADIDVAEEPATAELTKENEAQPAEAVTVEADAEAQPQIKTFKQEGKRGWYVIHTYSGYEDQVAESLKQRIQSFNMQEFIFNVLVPTEKQIEIKNSKRKVVEKKIFPGYVMVEMNVTDDSWYVVRNTPNVTGFIGLGIRPTPMMPNEVSRIKDRMGVKEPKFKIELKIDELIKITDGPLKNFEGKVTEIDEEKGKVKVTVNMFGRETPVVLDSLQVKKV